MAVGGVRPLDGSGATRAFELPTEHLAPRADGRRSATIISVAHLVDDECALVLGIVLDQRLAWVRTLTGTHQLRALLGVRRGLRLHAAAAGQSTYEASARGAHEASARLRRGRARRDAKSDGPRSNAGVWCVGRLQTDADRERVVEAFSGGHGSDVDSASLANVLKLRSRSSRRMPIRMYPVVASEKTK